MVSGNKSKAARSSRTRTPVVSHKSTPWGLIAAVLVVVLFAGGVFGYAFLRNQQNQAKTEALAPFTPTAENQDPSKQIPGVVTQGYPGGQHVGRETQVAYTHSPPFGGAHDERALLARQRGGLAHRAGGHEAVHAGLDQLLDVVLQRRDIDLVIGGERGGDGGDDACEGHYESSMYARTRLMCWTE